MGEMYTAICAWENLRLAYYYASRAHILRLLADRVTLKRKGQQDEELGLCSHSFGCSLCCDRLRGGGNNGNARADRNAKANIHPGADANVNVNPDTHPNASTSRLLAHRGLANLNA